MKAILKKNQIMITALAIMIAVAGYLNFAGSKLGEEELAMGDEAGKEVSGQAVAEGYPDEASAAEGIMALEEEYGLNDALEISDEDIEQAGIVDIESLDEDIAVAENDEMDEAMAEVGTMQEAEAQSADVTVGSADVASREEGDSMNEIPGEAVFTSTASVNTLSGAKLLKEQTRAKNKETLLDIINNNALSETQKQAAVDSMITLTDIAEKETAAEILLEAKGFDDVVVSISGDMADVVVGEAQLSDAQRAQIEDVIKRKTGIAAENIVISPVIAN
ncbi:MAG: SpoIIIAH-like family protein [Lachnospiraceae bacterium]|nr:SpoIIIAH-like family protein [Lachnospiraceae bacterium]